ncbi:MAG: peptide-methionine (R)-S-oxide reductase MsrB [Gammaproteobacteria bacterium]
MNRRSFSLSLLLSAGGFALVRGHAAEKAGGLVTIVSFSDAGESLGTQQVPKVVKTEAEWRKQLSSDSFAVARKEGTERPYSGEYNKLHDAGLFRCICCNNALFSSSAKFESGTGWPSFWQPIAKANVREITDRTFGMARTAVACTECDAHLGHVFDDGPRPTGLRYCMNSVSLKFIKKS